MSDFYSQSHQNKFHEYLSNTTIR